jgi:hypothetical protein
MKPAAPVTKIRSLGEMMKESGDMGFNDWPRSGSLSRLAMLVGTLFIG